MTNFMNLFGLQSGENAWETDERQLLIGPLESLKTGTERKKSAVYHLGFIVRNILHNFELGGDSGNFNMKNFDELGVYRQYKFLERAKNYLDNSPYIDADFISEIETLMEKAMPKRISPVGGFLFAKRVPGPLSDRELIYPCIDGVVVMPESSAVKTAEQFRKDNLGDKAALYLCSDPERESKRLRCPGYGLVVLLR